MMWVWFIAVVALVYGQTLYRNAGPSGHLNTFVGFFLSCAAAITLAVLAIIQLTLWFK